MRIVSASTQEIDENMYTSSYEIFVPIDDPSIIKPFSSLEQNKNDNGIIATLKITYFLRNNGQEIKLTNISGSWKSSSTSISIETKDREVAYNRRLWCRRRRFKNFKMVSVIQHI